MRASSIRSQEKHIRDMGRLCHPQVTRPRPSCGKLGREGSDVWHGAQMNEPHELSHLIDPGQVLTAIDALCPFRIDTTIIAVVNLETQHVDGARVVHQGPDSPDHNADGGSPLVRAAADSLGPERTFDPSTKRWRRITHAFVTVVCRDGRVIDTEREWKWYYCWRYANHDCAAFDGDIFVVTPHGWTGCFDRRAGFEPRSRPPLALVG